MEQFTACGVCRYWSELIAHADGGIVKAMCLSKLSPHAGKHTPGWHTCASWADGDGGAIDDPSQDPGRYPKEEA